jgi:hypothetical protein
VAVVIQNCVIFRAFTHHYQNIIYIYTKTRSPCNKTRQERRNSGILKYIILYICSKSINCLRLNTFSTTYSGKELDPAGLYADANIRVSAYVVFRITFYCTVPIYVVISHECTPTHEHPGRAICSLWTPYTLCHYTAMNNYYASYTQDICQCRFL